MTKPFEPGRIITLDVASTKPLKARVKTWGQQIAYIEQVDQVKALETNVQQTTAMVALLCKELESVGDEAPTPELLQSVTDYRGIWDACAALQYNLEIEEKKS